MESKRELLKIYGALKREHFNLQRKPGIELTGRDIARMSYLSAEMQKIEEKLEKLQSYSTTW